MSLTDPPLFQACNLCRDFDGDKIAALRGVDLEIRRNEFVAVQGPSGCGKSTLLGLLGLLDEPSQGEVRYRGASLRTIRDRAGFRARKIGFVFQAFHLLPTLSAWENVQVPMVSMPWTRRQRRERAEELLVAVGLAGRLRHLPGALSGGERQRVAVARSLANEPEVLLADEPTGNLDSAAARQVLDLLERIHRERRMTLVVVTHDPAVAIRATRVISLRDGRVVPETAP